MGRNGKHKWGENPIPGWAAPPTKQPRNRPGVTQDYGHRRGVRDAEKNVSILAWVLVLVVGVWILSKLF